MNELESLRSEIDALDKGLLDLIERRAQLAVRIAAAKLKAVEDNQGDIIMLRPDREALMLRLLLNRKDLTVSDKALHFIWRELIAESLRIQGLIIHPVTYAVSSRDPEPEVIHWTRVRFGQACDIVTKHDEKEVIEAAAQTDHIGILSLNPKGGAWWARLLARPEVSVIAVLPERGLHAPQAVALGRMRPEPSGLDMTFWVTDAQEPEAVIVDDLSLRGLAAEMIAQAQGFKLFGLTGFVQAEDPRLSGAMGQLTGIIGAAALLT